MTKILVTGADGQLGNELKVVARELESQNYELAIADNLVIAKYLRVGADVKQLAPALEELEFTFTNRSELDITNVIELENFLTAEEYDFCINCAAFTAVDRAEEESDAAWRLNVGSVQNLAKLCREHGIKLVHFSTDFVFDGQQSVPYKETDATRPLSVYGKSKLQGEEACLKENPEALVIRTSWLYSFFGNNFAKTIYHLAKEKDELRVVYDQVGAPTYAADLAEAVLSIILRYKPEKHSGIYHYSNEGVASWYDFAKAIIEFADIKCKLIPIETFEYPTPARRPHYSVLNKRRIKDTFGITIPYWTDSVSKWVNLMQIDEA